MLNSFYQVCNPFQENEKKLINLYTKHILPGSAADSVRNAHEIGRKQYEYFKQRSLYSPIKQNKLELFFVTSKTKMITTSLKGRCKLYASLM